jgi:hypothetical protein
MMDKQRNALSEDEIIEQAYALGLQDLHPENVLEACELFYGCGAEDEADGDADTFGYFYRVHRWIVWTDSQGFHDIETFDTEAQAEKQFGKYFEDYAATFDTDECF